MIDFTKFDNLFSVMEYFTTNKVRKQALAASRWSNCDVIWPLLR